MMKLQSARIAPIVFFATLFVAVNVVHAVCPRGFIKGAASGRCILPVFSGRKSFAEAKLACASRGLRLMPFETEADKKDAVSACRGSNCWVDVQQTPSPWGNEYGWYTTGMDCSRVTLIAGAWTSTKAHESSMLSPVNRGTCGMVKVTALCDASCAEKYHYLCTDPCECPEGLIRGKSSSRCILPVPTRKTFEDAKADCHRRGLVLMPIPNADYLKDATATCRGGMCWVGVEQLADMPAKTAGWYTTNEDCSQQTLNSTLWFPDTREPNDAWTRSREVNSENCAGTYRTGLADLRCSWAYRYICAQPCGISCLPKRRQCPGTGKCCAVGYTCLHDTYLRSEKCCADDLPPSRKCISFSPNCCDAGFKCKYDPRDSWNGTQPTCVPAKRSREIKQQQLAT